MLRLGVLFAIALTAQQAPPSSALIVGRVVDQSDGRPIPGAMVEVVDDAVVNGLAPSSPGPARRQTTDSRGRFVFRELAGGSYLVRVRTGGTGFSPNGLIQNGFGFPISAYLDGGYGQRRPGGPIQPLPLADGQAIPDVVVRLWRSAVVTGTIVDDIGEPVVDTVVGVAQMSTDGRLINGPTVRTDDRGVYRLSGLSPGRYIVFVPQTTTSMSAESADEAMRRINELAAAQNPGGPARLVPELTGFRVGAALVRTASTGLIDGNIAPRRNGDAVFVFQTTFHPAATMLASAAALELAAGEERQGVDVVMQPVRAAAVSGTILAGGAPASGVALRLVPAAGGPDAALFETARTQTDALGRFTLPLVPVGNYILSAANDPQPARAVALGTAHIEGTAGGPGAWLSENVGVGAEGVKDLVFAMKPGLAVRGQVEFTGASPRPTDDELSKGRFMLELRPPQPRARSAQGSATVQAIPVGSGLFSAIGVPPGRYVIRAAAVPPGPAWRIQSVIVGGREFSDMPFDVTEDLNNVRVIFTDKPAVLAGRVSSTDPAEAAISVVMFPADRSLWPEARAMTRRFRSARVNPNGDFAFVDVPPGDFLVVAIPDSGAAANWPDVSLLTKLLPEATSIAVTAGQRAAVALVTKAIR